MTTPTGDRLLNAGEVANLLNVPVRWVREHSRSGVIPHVRLGRYVRYRREAICAWVESCEVGCGPSFRRHRPGLAALTKGYC